MSACRLDRDLSIEPVGDDRCELVVRQAVRNALRRFRELFTLALHSGGYGL
jgi:hypothetical protein